MQYRAMKPFLVVELCIKLFFTFRHLDFEENEAFRAIFILDVFFCEYVLTVTISHAKVIYDQKYLVSRCLEKNSVLLIFFIVCPLEKISVWHLCRGRSYPKSSLGFFVPGILTLSPYGSIVKTFGHPKIFLEHPVS